MVVVRGEVILEFHDFRVLLVADFAIEGSILIVYRSGDALLARLRRLACGFPIRILSRN